MPAYAHILITSLNDCITTITRRDLLLLLWDTVIPYTWSDDPSTRSISLSVISTTMLKFAPNDEQILNKLHLSWSPLLAVLRQCPDYHDTLQFTLLMLSRAPDFLSQRYVKEWWPLLKSKPEVHHSIWQYVMPSKLDYMFTLIPLQTFLNLSKRDLEMAYRKPWKPLLRWNQSGVTTVGSSGHYTMTKYFR